MSFSQLPTRRFGWLAVIAAAACLLGLAAWAIPASAHAKRHHHASSSQKLRAAARARTRADHALVRAARTLKRCTRTHRGHCARERHALQRAGVRLSRAQRHLRRLAGQRQHDRLASRILRAPTLSVSGATLSWSHINHVSSYVVERKVPNQAADYTVRSTTSWTPPAVPGANVTFRVRTNVSGSTWSAPRSISYPAPPPPTTTTTSGSGSTTASPSPTPPPPVDLTTAPTLTASGQTLSWNQIGDVTNYVLVAKIAGQTDRFSQVTGTSVTPPAVAGATVQYSVRTAVDGSVWSLPVSITYPAPPPPPPPPPPSDPMIVGINGASYGTTGVTDVKNAVNYTRLDNGLSSTTFANYESAGVKVEVDLSGPYNSGGVSALNPTTWASNALSWYGANCSTDKCPFIEVLNEPWWPKWWGTNANSQTNADAYARLLKATYDAFHGRYGASAPKILASCEDQSWNNFWCDHWRNSSAVSNPLQYVDGVTVHPYGGTSNRTQSALGSTAEVTTAHTVTGKPVYVTEVGWPTATQCPSTGDSFQWSETDQANNITHFIDWARSTGYVAGVMYFNYHDFGSCDWYGVIRSDGTKKPGYYALKSEAGK